MRFQHDSFWPVRLHNILANRGMMLTQRARAKHTQTHKRAHVRTNTHTQQG